MNVMHQAGRTNLKVACMAKLDMADPKLCSKCVTHFRFNMLCWSTSVGPYKLDR